MKTSGFVYSHYSNKITNQHKVSRTDLTCFGVYLTFLVTFSYTLLHTVIISSLYCLFGGGTNSYLFFLDVVCLYNLAASNNTSLCLKTLWSAYRNSSVVFRDGTSLLIWLPLLLTFHTINQINLTLTAVCLVISLLTTCPSKRLLHRPYSCKYLDLKTSIGSSTIHVTSIGRANLTNCTLLYENLC